MVTTTIESVTFGTEDEWLEARKRYVTASEIACVCGLDPFKSPLRLYHEKRGEIEPQDLSANAAVQAGKALEGTILQMYERETSRNVDRCEPFRLFINSDTPDIAATPDGFDWWDDGGEGCVDAKNIGARMASRWDDSAPENYRMQVQQQMLVTGKGHGSLAVLIGGQDFRYFDYERNDRIQQAIVEHAAEFMRRVREGVEPDVDGTRDCAALLKELFPEDNGESVVLPADAFDLYDEWAVLKAEADVIGKKIDAIENKFRRWLGPATHGYLPDGTMACTNKTVQRKATTVKASSYRQLTRKKP